MWRAVEHSSTDVWMNDRSEGSTLGRDLLAGLAQRESESRARARLDMCTMVKRKPHTYLVGARGDDNLRRIE